MSYSNNNYNSNSSGSGNNNNNNNKKKRRKSPPKGVVCPFDTKTLDANLDYKAVSFISKFRSSQGKILSRKRTGLNKKHQDSLARAIKRARFLGLLGYVES